MKHILQEPMLILSCLAMFGILCILARQSWVVLFKKPSTLADESNKHYTGKNKGAR